MVNKRKNGSIIKPLNIVADSHIGLVRDCNEDSYMYCIYDDKQNVLAAVADGIGGHEGGDIASRLCIRTMLLDWKREALFQTASKNKLKNFLTNSLKSANKKIYELNKSFNIQHPMGTTIVAASFMRDTLITAHAGDSRIYRLRNGILEQLTEDHSYVADLVRNKLISIEEARDHPFSHIISRSIGPVEDVDIEIHTFDMKQGDRFLLCSDGLTTHLEDVEIETIMYNSITSYDAVKSLLYAALRGGGEDNITIMSIFT